jgi:hypothetical protein
MRALLILLLMLIHLESCNPTFDSPRYLKESNGKSIRRSVPLIRRGSYNNPTVKREARRSMRFPRE